jgi:hypothetical protein
MKVMFASAALAGVVLALAASAGGLLAGGDSAAQEAVTIGVDVEPAGNTVTSLGPIDACISVSTGDTFQVDIFVTDVADLLAWETYFVYDMSIINVVSRDVMMFQAANPGSNVWDVSEGLPDIDGYYRAAGVDIADPPSPESGSGVLARLTLEAVGAGTSLLSLSPLDVNDDGRMDLGPSLKDSEAEPIGDLNDDGFFDGPIANAEIAVGGTCPEGTPPPTFTAIAESPTPEASPSAIPDATAAPTETPTATAAASPTVPASPTEDEGSAWTGGGAIIGYILGGLAAVLLSGAALFAIRRSRAS